MFTLTIETDNAAFEHDDRGEIARILHELADSWPFRANASAGPLRDLNGNHVGAWRLGEAPPPAGGFLIAYGNPADGFAYCGPFADEDAATLWADGARLDAPWWVCPMHAPDAEA